MPMRRKPRRTATITAVRHSRGHLAVIASVIGLLAAPAVAAAAPAPNAYIVSITFNQTPAPAGGGAGQAGTWTCVWSDGTVEVASQGSGKLVQT